MRAQPFSPRRFAGRRFSLLGFSAARRFRRLLPVAFRLSRRVRGRPMLLGSCIQRSTSSDWAYGPVRLTRAAGSWFPERTDNGGRAVAKTKPRQLIE